jgi:tRNA (guanine26-N2/guanine27-N2)-dimethyltransferase
LISLTATDTAVLCGVYPKIALRRYGGLSLRCEYGNEVGARLLLGAAARQAMSINAGITPVFAHASRHYIRVYFTLESGASKADENLEKIGYINQCGGCWLQRERGAERALPNLWGEDAERRSSLGWPTLLKKYSRSRFEAELRAP